MVKTCFLPADTFSLETCYILLSFTDSCKRTKPFSITALEWFTLELSSDDFLYVQVACFLHWCTLAFRPCYLCVRSKWPPSLLLLWHHENSGYFWITIVWTTVNWLLDFTFSCTVTPVGDFIFGFQLSSVLSHRIFHIALIPLFFTPGDIPSLKCLRWTYPSVLPIKFLGEKS